MNAKTLALSLAMTAVLGCTPFRTELRRNVAPEPPLTLGGGTKGQIIAPKRCALRLAVLARPLNDPTLNGALWSVVDEQISSADARRQLEANGLRIGIVPGSLPQDVEAMLHAPPPHQIEPTQINIPSGDNTLFAVAPAAPRVTLILNRQDKTVGKDYLDVTGFIRLTATQEGPTGVSLRIVPELHHGPVMHRYAADTATNPYSVQQFVMKDGQEEETLRELAATITLQPGQVAVIGCRPECERSVGHFLLTEPEANSDRIQQKVLLVWAGHGPADVSPALAGASAAGSPAGRNEPGNASKTAGRPK
jgi:hypothetical protein